MQLNQLCMPNAVKIVNREATINKQTVALKEYDSAHRTVQENNSSLIAESVSGNTTTMQETKLIKMSPPKFKGVKLRSRMEPVTIAQHMHVPLKR